jgi:hypothetical protein
MFEVAERFLSDVVKEYGKHPVSTDIGRNMLLSLSSLSILKTRTLYPFSF